MTPKREADGNVPLCEAQCSANFLLSTGKRKCDDDSYSKYYFTGMVIA